ncbi:hypothetical protein G6M02_07830 [Agrobacterium rhizogenes]|nr:hypothetical protein [Rhizobium rhizogenes]
MSKIVAYACSTRPNALWSADQFDSAAPKNRTECDIPLVALSDLEAERQRTDAAKAMCDEMAKALEPFSEMAGEMFSRIWNVGKTDMALDNPSDPHRVTVLDFFAARQTLIAYRKAQEVGNV